MDALRRCPFLQRVGAAQGEAFACRLAANPVARALGHVLEEKGLSFGAALRLFHGEGGVVPLKRFAAQPAPEAPQAPVAAPGGSPYHAAAVAAQAVPRSSTSDNVQPRAQPATCAAVAAAAAPALPAARLPFASISISGFGFTVSLAASACSCHRCAPVHAAAASGGAVGCGRCRWAALPARALPVLD